MVIWCFVQSIKTTYKVLDEDFAADTYHIHVCLYLLQLASPIHAMYTSG